MGFRSNMSSSSGSSLSGRRKNKSWAPSTSKTALTPTSLLRKYALPVAAYLHTPETPPGLDISRPLLLYSNYSSTKVRAVSLKLTREGGLYPNGPALVIPDSYTGWFSVVTSEGRSASHYSSIEQVADSQLPFFLTRFDIPAYIRVVDEEDCGRTTYHRTIIQSGHVLKLLGVFEDRNARKNSSGSRRSKDSFVNCTKYAQCINYCNEVIFVPFSATGRFYATAYHGTKSVNHVFLMSQLVTTFQLPLTVRLVCGYMPRVPHAFTGILRLEQSQKEDVILACTMTAEAKATLLEMDVSSNFILSPVTDPIFTKTPIFLKTVSYCADEADSWRRQIKVTHHVTEDSSGSSLGRSSSGDKTMESSGSSSKGFSSFFEKRISRGRERSRTREFLSREKSRGDNPRQISDMKRKESKESNIFRSRDKSRGDGRIHGKLIHRFIESRKLSNNNPACVVSEEFITIKVDEKLKKSNVDNHRKVSKQNTYIFQNERILKYPEKKWNHSRIEEQPRSSENQNYSLVQDDISSPHKEDYEPRQVQEEMYDEICEHKIISDSRSGIVRADNRNYSRYWRTHMSDVKAFGSLSSTEDENNYSFTLLKKDMGKCYSKLPGLGYNDVIRHRQRKVEDSSVC